MKDSLQAGLSTEQTYTVSPEMGVKHLGDAGGVLSTPSMIGLIEQTCLQAMMPHLDGGEQSVGTMVHIWHRAPAKTGDEVTIRCKMIERDRRKCVFEVEVDAGDVRVGDGTHERFVVDLSKFKQT